MEPSLAQARDRLAGGLRLPMDETGDCYLFTNAPEPSMPAQQGVEFRFDVRPWTGLVTAKAVEITGVRVNGDELLTADSLCAGALAAYSRSALLPLKDLVNLPVYPVKGYSLTVPLRGPRLCSAQSRPCWTRPTRSP